MSAEQELVDLELARCDAITNGDITRIESMLSEDYLHVHGTGRITDQRQTLESFKAKPRTTWRGPLTVRLYGDIAVITGEMFNRMLEPTGERLIRAFTTQVARNVGGRWKFVSFHTTFIP